MLSLSIHLSDTVALTFFSSVAHTQSFTNVSSVATSSFLLLPSSFCGSPTLSPTLCFSISLPIFVTRVLLMRLYCHYIRSALLCSLLFHFIPCCRISFAAACCLNRFLYRNVWGKEGEDNYNIFSFHFARFNRISAVALFSISSLLSPLALQLISRLCHI